MYKETASELSLGVVVWLGVFGGGPGKKCQAFRAGSFV